MMSVSILPVKEQDAADWLALRNLLWLADDHASEIEQYFSGGLEEPVEVLIARDATGAAVGHVELSIRHDLEELQGIKTGYIEGLYVAPSHRSTDLVKRFLRESEKWALEQGCSAFASDRSDRVITHRKFAGSAV